MSTEQLHCVAIEERKRQNRFRQLRSFAIAGGAEISLNGSTTLVNFASNDYLGLSKHHLLKTRAIEYVERYGTGIGSSRLLSGNLDVYDKLEKRIADFKGTETALLLPTGFQANSSVIAALGQRQSLILSDRENHNSIMQGLQLSQGKWQRYRHNDMPDLQKRMEKPASAEVEQWIISESVFSMDGDVAPVDALVSLATKYDANLYLDEAHATGVLGKEGRGLAYGSAGFTIVMGTFSKAMGSFGAYIACTHKMREFLINFCSGLIYSTALPPAVLGAIDAALDVVPTLSEERERLLEMSQSLRNKVKQMGFETGNSSTQIIPILVGNEANALALAAYLEEQGILAPAIRPPTVPANLSRIRLSLTSSHNQAHIDHLVKCLANWRANA